MFFPTRMIGSTLRRFWTRVRDFNDSADRVHLVLAALLISFWLVLALTLNVLVSLWTPPAFPSAADVLRPRLGALVADSVSPDSGAPRLASGRSSAGR